MKKIIIVPTNDERFGLGVRVKAWYIAPHLLGFVDKKWIKLIKDP